MRILLDTCTFLWLAGDGPELSERARSLHQDPSNEVYLSAASAWEIAIKANLGRLPLPDPADRFVPETRDRLRVQALPLDEETVLAVSRLPDLHRDPFDRALVAQAIVHGLVLLTPDPAIAAYPARTTW